MTSGDPALVRTLLFPRHFHRHALDRADEVGGRDGLRQVAIVAAADCGVGILLPGIRRQRDRRQLQ